MKDNGGEGRYEIKSSTLPSDKVKKFGDIGYVGGNYVGMRQQMSRGGKARQDANGASTAGLFSAAHVHCCVADNQRLSRGNLQRKNEIMNERCCVFSRGP